MAWPKPTSSGLQCTGTYSGNTAWNPWTWSSISQQPVITVSQAKDLTDQGIQITWQNFTPTLDTTGFKPNPTGINPNYQVSIFECEGTSPDPSDGFNGPQCYMPAVGSTLTQASSGPANALVENTLDTSQPPKGVSTSILAKYPDKSSWNGGSPATWTGQADFHVEAPTPKTQGGFFNCGPSTPCSLVIVPNWGGTPVYDTTSKQFSWSDTKLCGQHWLGDDLDPTTPGPDKLGNPNPNPLESLEGDAIGDVGGTSGAGTQPYGSSVIPTQGSSGGVASVRGENYACWLQDRIVIPLSFAPTPNNCPGNAPAFYAEGSPMMQTQMLQWMTGWCTGSAPVTLTYTSAPEANARTDFLAGGQAAVAGASTDMALLTLPVSATQQQGSSRKFTYAPLANSGTGVAYEIDDPATGSQISGLVLDPRLLAKLTTQSYTLNYGCTTNPGSPWKPTPQANDDCDPAVVTVQGGKVVHRNPFSLFDDQEFLSLNKHCQPYGSPDRTCGPGDYPPDNGGAAFNGVPIGGFLPTAVATDNDMTYDLTGWIAADSDAAGFLKGQADPYGTHVNTNYVNVSYPIQAFNVLDNGVSYPGTYPCTSTSCSLGTPDESMQASWNFPQNLDQITADLLTDQATADSPLPACGLGGGNGCTSPRQLNPVSAAPPEYIGSRALMSELDLGDIEGYLLPAAGLVNAAGKAVGPTQESIEAAVNDMKTNADGITQYFDYATKDPNAYPLTMVDYAMVPTCGLSHTEASAIADFLTKAATTGQVQGEAPGDLAPGYYPLTAKQKAQTLKAAQEVKDQTCKSPPSDHSIDGNPASGTTPGGSGSPGKKSANGHQSPAGQLVSTDRAKALAYGQKSADSGLDGLLLALAIIIGVLLVLGGPTAWVITATGRWPMVLGWVRAVPARLQAGFGRLAGLVIRRA